MFAYYENRIKSFAFENTNMKNGRPLDFPPHIHPHIELIYIKEGQVSCSCDLKEYDAESDDLFVAFPNQVHEYRGKTKHAFTMMIIDPEYIPDFSNIYGKKIPESAIIKSISQYPTMRALLKMITSEYLTGQDSNRIVLQGLLYALFGEIYNHSTFVEQASHGENSVNAIIKFCSKNFKSNITLESIEKEVHLNKYYISHIFSDKLNISFTEYINLLRLTEACKMLSETKMSVTQISEAAGFNTTRTFNRAFLKKFGLSPMDYRKKAIDAPAEK